MIGTTDHAADYLLPPIMAALGAALPDLQVTFRFGRTAQLNEAIDRGSVDLAAFITEASTQPAEPLGSLPLVWSAAPGWTAAAQRRTLASDRDRGAMRHPEARANRAG